MSQDLAQVVLVAITVLGGLVWLAGFSTLIHASRDTEDPGEVPIPETGSAFDSTISDRDVLSGSADVEGNPSTLSARAATHLAGLGTSGTLKILERREHRLVFMGTGVTTHATRLARPIQVVIRFEALGGSRTRVSYEARMRRGRTLLWAGGVFQVAGLIALIGGYLAMRTYIVPNPNLAIRSQVVQMIQVIHVLWPPFLLAHLHRQPRIALRGQLDSLIHNLPYLAV